MTMMTTQTTPAPAFTTLSRQRRRRPAPTSRNGRRPQPCPTTPSPLAVSDDDDDDVATADAYQHPQLHMTAKIISCFQSGLSTPTQQVSFFLFILFYFLYNRSAAIMTMTTTSAVSPAYQCQLAQQVFFFLCTPSSSVATTIGPLSSSPSGSMPTCPRANMPSQPPGLPCGTCT